MSSQFSGRIIPEYQTFVEVDNGTKLITLTLFASRDERKVEVLLEPHVGYQLGLELIQRARAMKNELDDRKAIPPL